MNRLRTMQNVLVDPNSKLHQGIVNRSVLLLAVSGGATMLGTLGTFHWFLELLSHFVVWHAMVTSLAIVQFSIIRRWRWAAVACVLFCLQASIPLRWYLPPPARPEISNCRVLLANVLSTNTNKQAFLDLVAATSPDVICVQETDDAWAAALKSLEKEYPLNSIVPRSDNFGIAFYTRLSGRMSGVLFQTEHDVPGLAATVEIAGRHVSILDVHTVPPLGSLMARRRNDHYQSIRAWFEAQSTPAMLLGDLNLTMFSPEYGRFVEGLGLRNARNGFGPLGTWPTWIPFARLPLDQCLVRGDIDVVRCAVGPEIGSDHLPLVVDLFIPPA